MQFAGACSEPGRATKNADPRARVSSNSNLLVCLSARSARTRGGTATATRTTLGAGARTEYRLWLHRQQTFTLQFLAGKLARAAHGLGLFAGLLLRGLFIMSAELHLAENTLALHLLLQRLEGLIDVVIANENLQAASSFQSRLE